MSTNVEQLPLSKKQQTSVNTRAVDSTREATSSLTPELVIALCGPIGSPLHDASDRIGAEMASYGYRVEKIRLSDAIEVNAEKVGVVIQNGKRAQRISSLIKAGDALREKFGNDILAKMAISKISADRKTLFGGFNDKAAEERAAPESRITRHRICHVIDSIKNKAELELFRLIYGDALVSIGVFSPLESRLENLKHSSLQDEEISSLIQTDSGEEFSHGQSVRDTFPRCDFFLRVDKPMAGATKANALSQIDSKIRRLLGLIFRTAVITPTADETAMYAASSAARNSACLSRQVGAAVTSSSGEVLAVGWNDVPQPGGGLYGKFELAPCTPQALEDRRCFALPEAKCHNDAEKKLIASKVANILMVKGLVSEERVSAVVDAISSDSQIKDLIEFSRAVHAEMHAILNASRLCGQKIVGGKIFVTTYPCHSCARHIVAAGIHEIHYIEPYRKSLATRLHKDALTEKIDDTTKVRLIQFDGVAPRRFIDLFEAGSRKQDGVLTLPQSPRSIPATQVSLKAIPRLEEVVVAEVDGSGLDFNPVARKDYEE